MCFIFIFSSSMLILESRSEGITYRRNLCLTVIVAEMDLVRQLLLRFQQQKSSNQIQLNPYFQVSTISGELSVPIQNFIIVYLLKISKFSLRSLLTKGYLDFSQLIHQIELTVTKFAQNIFKIRRNPLNTLYSLFLSL